MSPFAPDEEKQNDAPDERPESDAPETSADSDDEKARRKEERKAAREAAKAKAAAEAAAEKGKEPAPAADAGASSDEEDEKARKKAERKAAREAAKAAAAAEAAEEKGEEPAPAADAGASSDEEDEKARRKAERKAAREAAKAAAAAEAGGDDKPAESDDEKARRKAERKAAREAAKAAAADAGGDDKPAETDEEKEKRRAERKAAREAAKAAAAEGGDAKPEKKERKERPAKAAKDDKPAKKEKDTAAVPSRKFILSSSPHIHDKESVRRIMWTVTATLVPATIGATWVFGFRALMLVALGASAAMLTEWGLQKLFKAKSTVADGSAFLTGLLVSFNLPPGVPWWIPVIGAFFAIAIAKMPFGGLGWNPMNPALIGRAFLLASWPLHMTKDWLPAFWWKMQGYNFFTWNVNPAAIKLDGVSYATPLEVRKSAISTLTNPEGLPNDVITRAMEVLHSTGDKILDLVIGVTGGCIGETSAILLLIGGVYLLYKGYIDWRTPFAFIATVGLGGWLFGGADGFFSGDMLFHIFAGGLILGAVYMATDMVTTPITKKGRLIFGIGCGLITLMIRLIGGYPEGVSYAILLMNLTTPLIDRYTKPRRFGHIKVATAEARG
ncbi:RnfABCDGE type electron transport complex subunit D [bacterium]|nr:RnfABCDGE type electron transport complex subunit D [bacterium]